MGQKLSKKKAAAKEGYSASKGRTLRREKSRPEMPVTAGDYDNTLPPASMGRQIEPPQQVGSLYKPLNRSQNEIRLIRILPPAKRQVNHDPAKALEICPDMIECWVEYDSMDVIRGKNAKSAAESAVRGLLVESMLTPTNDHPLPQGVDPRLMEVLKQAMQRDLDANLDESILSPMNPVKKKLLEDIFNSSKAKRSVLEPPDVLLTGSSGNADSWLNTWIWASLSGHDVHPESVQGGYFALSYVWSDPKLPMLFQSEEISQMIKLSQAGGRNLDAVLGEFDTHLMHESGVVRTQRSKRIIKVNGRYVDVGCNLESALRTLREIPEVQLGKRIWIDSLCINQSDIDEKNHEVKRMGDIYSQADRVISWIGDDEHYAGDVLEMMNTIGGSILSAEDCSVISNWFFSFIESNMGIYIAKLLARPYWSRIWIVQEIAMGSEKSLIICGNRRFPTKHLLRFASRILNDAKQINFNRHLQIQSPSRRYSDAIDVGLLLSGLRKLCDICTLQHNLQSLTSELAPANTLWFRISSNNYATDPKDLLYGMMNLLPSQITKLIEPDYSPSHTYRDVMVDFAAANIQANASTYWILFRPWSPFPGWEDWPSWVPNLGLPFSSAHFYFNLRFDMPRRSNDQRSTNSYTVHHIMNYPALSCAGYLIDTINQSTKSSASARRDINQALIMQPWLLDQIAHTMEVDETLLRKQIRSTAAGWFPEALPPDDLWLPSSPQHRYHDVHGMMTALSMCFRKLKLSPLNDQDSIFSIPLEMMDPADSEFDPKSVQNFTVDPNPLQLLHSIVEQFSTVDLWGLRLRDLFARSSSRGPLPQLRIQDRTALLGRLFTTCSGYIGTTISNVCVGDRLYFLAGCPMPVALRPSVRVDGAFELVGSAYIPGLLEDSPVDQIMANCASPETITLV
ncbi:heterokaryon incompatibility protein-domain-containing protein [Paraphoma chrysanthemicola]|uniref:Heterokaryon incompatibility protein-domain-containing protein n=1 Tax=Paraphoma chrysanthemicola TaxID=798071 RepID=A0A8K0RK76_9PLEO|nr:heterokaryon incompatibility protein-domain-containing protein [Paraphoma chrysanthemicola]